MKTIRVLPIIIATAGLLLSCEEKLETPDFDVTATVTKTTALSDDGSEEFDAYEVKFRFSGTPDNIVFYSGEEGEQYRYRDRYYRSVTPYVQFSSSYQGGNMPNTLRVMVSNDFKPEYEYLSGAPNKTVYTVAGVKAATWTDITDRFALPGNNLTAGEHTSSEKVISEFHSDIPLFIAFEFDADRSSNASLSPGQWTFSQFRIKNVFEDGTSALYIDNVLDNNWKAVDLADHAALTVSSNRITLDGSQAQTVKTMLISRPFYPSQVTSDKGLAIKSVEENLYEYTHLYVAPQTGSAEVAFVATNSLYGEDSQVVKKLEIVFE